MYLLTGFSHNPIGSLNELITHTMLIKQQINISLTFDPVNPITPYKMRNKDKN